jgi:hypothetical protein
MPFLTLPVMPKMIRAPFLTGYDTARFNAVTAVLSIPEAFCNVTPRRLVTNYRRFERSSSSLKTILWPPDLETSFYECLVPEFRAVRSFATSVTVYQQTLYYIAENLHVRDKTYSFNEFNFTLLKHHHHLHNEYIQSPMSPL